MYSVNEIIGKECTYYGTYYDNDFNEKDYKAKCIVVGFKGHIEEGTGNFCITASLKPSTDAEATRLIKLSDDDEICMNLYGGVELKDIIF